MSVGDDTILRVTATFDMPGTAIAQTVHHVITAFGGPQFDTDVVDECLLWVEEMMETMEDTLSQNMGLNNVEVSELVSTDPAVWVSIGSESSSFVGLVTEQAVSHGVALVIRAGLDGVSSLARKYIPGIAETFVNEASWEAATLVAAANYLLVWIFKRTISPGNDLFAGIFSIATETFKALDGSGAIAAIPGYQRRRKPGVGL